MLFSSSLRRAASFNGQSMASLPARRLHRALLGLIGALLAGSLARADEAVSISQAKPEANGFLVHEVRSPYQSGATQIRVLLPDALKPKTSANEPYKSQGRNDKKVPVIYVLPVEAGVESRYGDGLKEIKELELHNRCQVVFVAPTFSQLPWYADHPTQPEIRQESYLLKVVVPFIDQTYPVQAEAEGRLLLGFSKSGWGAWSLLLRHPELFGRAVAWDAPLMLDQPGKYGSGPIFGTPENFEGYRVGTLLVDNAAELNAAEFQEKKRLVLLGYGNFRGEHELAHALLERWNIAHEYRDGPHRAHDWHSGWVKEAVELLVEKPAE